MLTGTQTSKPVIRMTVGNKTKQLITTSVRFIRNHESFDSAFLSTLCAVIDHFAICEGWSLGPSNTERFAGQSRISFLNSSNCCKMIVLNNDITLNVCIPWNKTGPDSSVGRVSAESLGPMLPITRAAKTLIRLGGCPGWSESSLGAPSFCWFCHEAAHLSYLYLR